VILCATYGLATEDAIENGHEESRNRADEERLTPAPGGSHLTSCEIAERCADGNGDIKDGEYAVAIALRVEVSDDSGREDSE